MHAAFHRHDHVNLTSALAALILTCAAFAAILGVSGDVMAWRAAPVIPDAPVREHVVYIAPPRLTVVTPVAKAAPKFSARFIPGISSRAATIGAAAPTLDSSSQSSVKRKATAAAGALPVEQVLVPSLGRPKALVSRPIEIEYHNPWAGNRLPTEAERLETAEDMAIAMERLARLRNATTAEKDSIMKERSRESLIPGRRGQVPSSAGGAISLPIFSPGPSAAERKRDKVANAEYLSTLGRLQARVQQRSDSMVADSLARSILPETL